MENLITLSIEVDVPAHMAEDYADRFMMWSGYCNGGTVVKRIVGKKNNVTECAGDECVT